MDVSWKKDHLSGMLAYMCSSSIWAGWGTVILNSKIHVKGQHTWERTECELAIRRSTGREQSSGLSGWVRCWNKMMKMTFKSMKNLWTNVHSKILKHKNVNVVCVLHFCFMFSHCRSLSPIFFETRIGSEFVMFRGLRVIHRWRWVPDLTRRNL